MHISSATIQSLNKGVNEWEFFFAGVVDQVGMLRIGLYVLSVEVFILTKKVSNFSGGIYLPCSREAFVL
jgi:hypothetical protein